MHKPNKIVYNWLILVVLLLLVVPIALSLPTGPTVEYIRNETKTSTQGKMINTSGGSITTMVLNATTQNYRWKAYVGNVTGRLTLDDANDHTVFDWKLTTIVGEVYATRNPNSINWNQINCSTPSNITNEEIAINHTNNPDDNISATFATKDHNTLYVGSIEIPQDSCYSIHTYVNDTNQSTNFEEILLHDKQSVVYATVIESDELGYDPTQTFDFQLIVPEVGLPTWTSSTPYYFYVELV